MNYKCFSKDHQITSHWSGGTTTQLFIYPEEAEYKKQNFKFRISSAKVEVDESVFTKLEGIQRHLMVLDGELRISHKGHHGKQLSPFEVDSFKGDWETEAQGCVTDFNLMLSSDMTGRLEHVRLDGQENYTIDSINSEFVGVFVWKGSVFLEEINVQLNHGDFAMLYLTDRKMIPKVIAAEKDTDVILSFISHK